MADDASAPATLSRRPRDFQSPPYLNQKRRMERLYPELKALGLQPYIADLAVQGYTVLPPELVARPNTSPPCATRCWKCRNGARA